jgi:hypothetical protein
MKKLILVAACIGLMVSAVVAQTQSSTPPATKTAKASAKYYCPKCMASSDKAGTCAHCKVAMVKEGTYYCPGCYATSDKPGKCKKCNKDLVMMTAPKATQSK